MFCVVVDCYCHCDNTTLSKYTANYLLILFLMNTWVFQLEVINRYAMDIYHLLNKCVCVCVSAYTYVEYIPNCRISGS